MGKLAVGKLRAEVIKFWCLDYYGCWASVASAARVGLSFAIPTGFWSARGVRAGLAKVCGRHAALVFPQASDCPTLLPPNDNKAASIAAAVKNASRDFSRRRLNAGFSFSLWLSAHAKPGGFLIAEAIGREHRETCFGRVVQVQHAFALSRNRAEVPSGRVNAHNLASRLKGSGLSRIALAVWSEAEAQKPAVW